MFLIASRGYMRSGIALGYNKIEIAIWLWIGCTVATTIVSSQQNFYTNGRYGKRQDPGTVSSFWSGSRYGRSGDSAGIAAGAEEAAAAAAAGGRGRLGGGGRSGVSDEENIAVGSTKGVEVSPRTDRFFLGSRYGKRTFSNDRSIDSLKHFETSLDFLISVNHMQTNDKEQLQVLTEELNGNENSVTLRSRDDDNNYFRQLRMQKNYQSFSDNRFTCLYTGVTNLYRCFHRRSNGTQGSSN